MELEEWIGFAKSLGFTEAAALDPKALKPNPEVRAMCAADKCHAYGKNWTCPPVCGSLEECAAEIREKHFGILVQTVGQLEDAFDIETMMDTEKEHLARFHLLADKAHAYQKEALALGTGGCRICKTCAYPDACRFPDRACASMEGYGLLVNEACASAGVAYYYGKDTIAYTACILFT